MEALTSRQLEILACFGKGKNAPQTAKDCFISPKTVHRTLEDARKILGVPTNVQALLCAIADEQLILDHKGDVRVPGLTV